jgi:SAM-dependent methyltransferase
MLRYYTWAVAEKTLSIVPGGKALYRGVGRVAKHRSRGVGSQMTSSFPLARKAKELVAPGGEIVDLGSGWFNHDAFLLYLVGDWRVHLFDIEDRARLQYIRNFLSYLVDGMDAFAVELGIDADEARDKLRELLALPTREAIYARCNFHLVISDEVDKPFLPEGSVDFMLSNCVLGHIRPEVLDAELVALGRMLKPDGAMYHLIGHDDHWAFHDKKAMGWPSFNYLRYSERTYRLLFDTKLEYHNRIVKPEWLEIFDRAGLTVLDWDPVITEDSRQAVRSLPHIDRRFAGHSLDELAIVHSYVLLEPRPDGPAAAGGAAQGLARAT